MPTTTNEHISYPAGTVGVPPDVRGDLQSLATTADTAIHDVRSYALQGGTDTGWSLPPITMASGWDTRTDPNGHTSGTLQGGVRKIGTWAVISFRCSRNGGTVSGNGTGNIIPDMKVATVSPTYSPSASRYGRFAIPGAADGLCLVASDGSIYLNTINNGATIPNNTPVQIDIVYPLG